MDEKDKTHLYGDEKNNKTSIYNNNIDDNKTGVYSNNVDNEIYSSQGINIGDKLRFKENEYTVKQLISQGTGEANVYLIEDSIYGLYGLKLYFEFKDQAEEPNGIALERILKLNDPDILKLIDFGVGPDKYNGKYCYEISEFAQGGNILDVADFKKKYSPQFIEKTIVPQIYLSITKLHEYKIYHCDIKPGNILYKDKEQTDIILGDYGSAKAYDLKSEKELRKSTTVKGTEFYLAPEQARGIVSGKNDYYSFGMVLLHLLYPESFSSDPDFRKIDKDKFEQIVERQYNMKPIIEFNPQWKSLNTLIEGLTLVNHINRWGAGEFEKWLNGETVQVSYRTKEALDVKPLKTGPIEIYSSQEFINYIETKPTWFQDFFEDPEVYKLIKDWLDSYIGIPDRKRFEKLVDIYKLSGKLILQSALTLFLLPQKPLEIEGQFFDLMNTDKLAKVVAAYVAKIDSIYKVATIDHLALYFFQLEFTLKTLHYQDSKNQIILALLYKFYNPIATNLKLPDNFDFKTTLPAHIKPAKGTYNYEYLISVFYSFNSERAFPDNAQKPIVNEEFLAIFYLKNKNLFNDKYHVFERNALLKKIKCQELINTNLQQLVSKALSKHAEVTINIDHIAFEKICNVHYSIAHVLDSILILNDIHETLIIKEEKGYMYVDKNRVLSNNAANVFIKYLVTEHGGMFGSSSSLEKIKAEFIKRHRKNYLVNYIVSAITTLFIIGVLIAIILRLYNVAHIFFNQ